MNEYEKVLEQLIQIFTAGDFQKEALNAKREFFERAGIVDEESVNFEMRMSQFLDWYMFSRELSEDDLLALKRLFVRYLADKATRLADELFEQKGWTNDDMNKLAHTHLRTPYKKRSV